MKITQIKKDGTEVNMSAIIYEDGKSFTVPELKRNKKAVLIVEYELQEDNMNINERIEKLEAELTELKRMVEPKKWVPKEREKIYIVLSNGEIRSALFARSVHQQAFKRGRIFRTEPEAIFFSEQELVRAELWALADDDSVGILIGSTVTMVIFCYLWKKKSAEHGYTDAWDKMADDEITKRG